MEVWNRWRTAGSLRGERRRATWSSVDPAAELDGAWAAWDAGDLDQLGMVERTDDAA